VPSYRQPQSINRYVYVAGNPVRYTDPSGYWYYDPSCDCIVYEEGVSYNTHPEYLYPGYPNIKPLEAPWVDEQTWEMRAEYPNSCGLLALYMFLQAEGKHVNLSTLARQLQGERPGGYDGYCCRYDSSWEGVPSPSPDPLGWCNPACVSAEALADVARKYYGMEIESGDNWTSRRVRQKLVTGHPVLALVRVDLSTDQYGHFVVLRGSSATEVVFNDSYPREEAWDWSPEERQAFGEGRTESWSQFDASWSSRVDINDDPLAPEGHARWAMAAQ
jgi:uncharacterized protein YvpB